MRAEPGRRFLKQPAAKLEPVIVQLRRLVFHRCNFQVVCIIYESVSTVFAQTLCVYCTYYESKNLDLKLLPHNNFSHCTDELRLV